MDTLVSGLGPAFAAAFALQQLMEILDPVLDHVKKFPKKMTLGLLSLGVGLILAFGAGLRVLEPMGFQCNVVWDGIVTALMISGGTEGFNSVIKFLGYVKTKKKEEVVVP